MLYYIHTHAPSLSLSLLAEAAAAANPLLAHSLLSSLIASL
jgi:hypothetical protein